MAGSSLILAVKNGNEETTLGLFDGETLLGWEGDRAAFSGE